MKYWEYYNELAMKIACKMHLPLTKVQGGPTRESVTYSDGKSTVNFYTDYFIHHEIEIFIKDLDKGNYKEWVSVVPSNIGAPRPLVQNHMSYYGDLYDMVTGMIGETI